MPETPGAIVRFSKYSDVLLALGLVAERFDLVATM